MAIWPSGGSAIAAGFVDFRFVTRLNTLLTVCKIIFDKIMSVPNLGRPSDSSFSHTKLPKIRNYHDVDSHLYSFEFMTGRLCLSRLNEIQFHEESVENKIDLV